MDSPQPQPVLEQLRAVLTRPSHGWIDSERSIRFAARASAFFFACGGLVFFGLWSAADHFAVLSGYSRYVDPVMAVLLLTCSGLALRLPRLLPLVLWTVIGSVGLYFQGALFYYLCVSGAQVLFRLSVVALFMPLYYISTFLLAGRRFAGVAAWGHSLLTMIQCGLGISMVGSDNQVRQFLVCLLVAQPLYLMALTLLSVVRDQVLLAQEQDLREKAALLSMMSHEIRSPLQTMLSSIELLELQIRSHEERVPLSRIRSASARLDAYLRDVIIYNKMDTSKQPLQHAPFNLAEVIDDVVHNYRGEVEQKGLDLQVMVGAEVKAVMGDAERVKQIVTNLLSNAIKYTSAGRVELSAQSLPHDPQLVSIIVKDTGLGIDPAQQHLIWRPFMRTSAAKQSGVEGSGLGLAVVKHLVKAMHGTVHLASKPGAGSTFTVVLPLKT